MSVGILGQRHHVGPEVIWRGDVALGEVLANIHHRIHTGVSAVQNVGMSAWTIELLTCFVFRAGASSIRGLVGCNGSYASAVCCASEVGKCHENTHTLGQFAEAQPTVVVLAQTRALQKAVGSQ